MHLQPTCLRKACCRCDSLAASAYPALHNRLLTHTERTSRACPTGNCLTINWKFKASKNVRLCSTPKAAYVARWVLVQAGCQAGKSSTCLTLEVNWDYVIFKQQTLNRHPPALADVPMALKTSSDAGVAARWLGRWLRQQSAWKEGHSPDVACMCTPEDVPTWH